MGASCGHPPAPRRPRCAYPIAQPRCCLFLLLPLLLLLHSALYPSSLPSVSAKNTGNPTPSKTPNPKEDSKKKHGSSSPPPPLSPPPPPPHEKSPSLLPPCTPGTSSRSLLAPSPASSSSSGSLDPVESPSSFLLADYYQEEGENGFDTHSPCWADAPTVPQADTPAPSPDVYAEDDSSPGTIHHSDWLVLVALAKAWGNSTDLSAWYTQDAPCDTLPGVTCDDSGHVITLSLPASGLTGPIPNALGGLTHLQYLVLSNNKLWGLLPPSISSLHNLLVLRLDNNMLSPFVPHSLFLHMPNLQELSLSQNRLRGSLPDFSLFPSSLSFLDLSANLFSSTIPPQLSLLSNLQVLFLHKNQLSGPVPDIFPSLPSLLALDLSSNLLVGPLPLSLPLLPSLFYLDLSNNQLTGPPPTGFLSPSMGSRASVYNIARNYFTGPASVYTLPRTQFCPTSQSLTPAQGSPGDSPSHSHSHSHSHSKGGWKPGKVRPGDLQGLSDSWYQLPGGLSLSTTPSIFSSQELNCLSYPSSSSSSSSSPSTSSGSKSKCPKEQQRTAFDCVGFCGASLPSGPCAGHGTCLLTGSSYTPACSCSWGYHPASSSTLVQGVTLSFPTCSPLSGSNTTAPGPPINSSSLTTGLAMSSMSTLPSPSSHFNKYFRYSSVGYTGTPDNPSWNYSRQVDWRTKGVVPDPVDQGPCAACWAVSAVEAVGSALAIVQGDMRGVSPGPSVQEVLDCNTQGLTCTSGGWPGDAFSFLISQGSLADAQAYPFSPWLPPSSTNCQSQVGTLAAPVMYEEISSFYAWLGLALALQQQPVVVNVAASALSFRNFPGGFVYNDPECFASGVVDHNLVVVGYALDAPVPYWILLNSWGPDWGDQGYMNMAIYPHPDPSGSVLETGSGVCGIYATPALYPVVVNGTNPCGPINPCGQGVCSPVPGTRLNTCRCPAAFVAVNNTDGSQSCSPVNTCAFFPTNPCGVGSCANDKRGSYSCVCPLGFLQGTNTLGSPTCIPSQGSSSAAFLVPSASVSCYMLAVNWGLTQQELVSQNPGLNCSKRSIPPGTVLTVHSARNCSLPYSITPLDNCSSISSMFGLNTSHLLLLNPALNCTNLFPGLQVCVDRSEGQYQLPLCTSIYNAQSGDTCQNIMNLVAKPPLSPYDFFSFNPGLMCNNLQPSATALSPLGTQVCLQSSSSPLGLVRCLWRTYTVKLADTCTALISRFYKSTKVFVALNRFVCTQKALWRGRVLCLPRGVRPT